MRPAAGNRPGAWARGIRGRGLTGLVYDSQPCLGNGISAHLRRWNNDWDDVHDCSHCFTSGLCRRSLFRTQPLSRSGFRYGQSLFRIISRVSIRFCRWTVHKPPPMDPAIADGPKTLAFQCCQGFLNRGLLSRFNIAAPKVMEFRQYGIRLRQCLDSFRVSAELGPGNRKYGYIICQRVQVARAPQQPRLRAARPVFITWGTTGACGSIPSPADCDFPPAALPRKGSGSDWR